MKKIILISFLLLLFSGNNFSQDTNIIKYLPLKVGNSWTYIYSFATPPYGGCSYYINYKITDSTFQNGHYYYNLLSRRTGQACTTYSARFFENLQNIRIDSFTTNIYKNMNESCIFDSINSALNDSRIACQYYYGNIETCTEFYTLTIFGVTRPYKKFRMYWGEQFSSTIYVQGLGVYSSQYSFLTNTSMFTLKGCVVNGVLFGDTSLTAISQISTEIPGIYSLSQNYTNPFNPTTKIKFSIPLDSRLRGNDNVVLKVYDALGREVQTLVNEQLSSGTYEVEFPSPTGNGTDFSSGVYYYQLTVSNEQSAQLYRETKKMILIK